MGSLTATAVKAAKEPGRYGDGDGLFLLIGKRGGKSWMVRVQKDGRRRDIGLGSAKKVSLKLARERAAEVRAQIEAGIDPVAERQKAAVIPTFAEAAKAVHAENAPSWKNAKHTQQWINTLKAHVFPAFGSRPVSAVDATAVRDCLAAIWLEKPETARRVRQRIVTVIDWAVAKGYRESGLAMPVVDKALPKQRRTGDHHPALPYPQLPEFVAKLRRRESKGRLTLEFAILTCARTVEVLEMRWAELDHESEIWRVPPQRMKAGREHIAPLSEPALSIIDRMKSHRTAHNPFVFPGQARGKPQSNMTMNKVMRDLHTAELGAGRSGFVDPHMNGRIATPHGFRSTFRDWVGEETNWSPDLAEAALAHVVSDKTVAAYQRGSMLEKRRELMSAWGKYAEKAA